MSHHLQCHSSYRAVPIKKCLWDFQNWISSWTEKGTETRCCLRLLGSTVRGNWQTITARGVGAAALGEPVDKQRRKLPLSLICWAGRLIDHITTAPCDWITIWPIGRERHCLGAASFHFTVFTVRKLWGGGILSSDNHIWLALTGHHHLLNGPYRYDRVKAFGHRLAMHEWESWVQACRFPSHRVTIVSFSCFLRHLLCFVLVCQCSRLSSEFFFLLLCFVLWALAGSWIFAWYLKSANRIVLPAIIWSLTACDFSSWERADAKWRL